MFFVISGFILPFSISKRMEKGVLCRKAFLFDRLRRIFPAFWASGVLTICLWYLSSWAPGFAGQAPVVGIKYLISNSLMVANLVDSVWIIPVYWSLPLEIQFYVLIACVLPQIRPNNLWVQLLGFPAVALAPFLLNDARLLMFWLPVFGLGVVSYWQWSGSLESSKAWLWRIVFVIAIGVTHSAGVAAVSAVSSLLLLSPERPTLQSLRAMGIISYSFYLIHVPIGGRVINLSKRLNLENEWIQFAAVASAFVISLVTAYGFFIAFEKPFLSRRKAAT